MSAALLDNISLIGSKLFTGEDFITDNLIFKIQRLYMVCVMVAFSVVLSLSQYVGDPIDCLQFADNSIDGDTFDTYCWVEGTYTTKSTAPKRGSIEHLKCDENEDCWHHKYYQWVALVILCQAGCFYLPRFLWQIGEEGRIKALVSGLDRKTLIRGLQSKEALAHGECNDKIKDLMANWLELRGANDMWAWKFYLCEILNLVNVVGQFFLTDFFLGGHFQDVGLGGLTVEVHNSILPITAECRFERYGTGGRTSTIKGLCVLPLNMVNQKFYTFFWLALSTLLLLNAIMVSYRLMTLLSREVRDFMLRFYYRLKEMESAIVQKLSHGDWLLLTFLLDNMNHMVRYQFITELGKITSYEE